MSNNIISEKSLREADVGLGLESQGKLKGPIVRDPSGAAEFIDAEGTKFDVKAFNSNFPVRKGGFSLERDVAKIESEIESGENVILDTENLTDEHIQQLREEITAKGLDDRVLWYP